MAGVYKYASVDFAMSAQLHVHVYIYTVAMFILYVLY